MNTLWRYVEEHHEEYGVALFIVPVLLVVLTVVSIGWCVSRVFQW